jgi:hypothetical protein
MRNGANLLFLRDVAPTGPDFLPEAVNAGCKTFGGPLLTARKLSDRARVPHDQAATTAVRQDRPFRKQAPNASIRPSEAFPVEDIALCRNR